MVDDEKLLGAQQLVGDDQRANGIVAGAAARIAGDVSIAFGQAGILGRIQSGIHTGQDGKTAGRRQGQIALGETGGIAFVGFQDFSEDFAHGVFFSFDECSQVMDWAGLPAGA